MYRINRSELETVLTEVSSARWHDADHAKWMSSIIAVLTLFAHRARGNSTRAHTAAERIVWTVFQCITNPDEQRQTALEFNRSEDPTPDQQAEDATQLNRLAKRLMSVFGLKKFLHTALLRMQAADQPFYHQEYWVTGQAWIEQEFFSETA